MPLTKKAYEKAYNKPLTDEQYVKIQERVASPEAAPTVVAADGTEHSAFWPRNPYVMAEAGKTQMATAPPAPLSEPAPPSYATGMSGTKTFSLPLVHHIFPGDEDGFAPYPFLLSLASIGAARVDKPKASVSLPETEPESFADAVKKSTTARK